VSASSAPPAVGGVAPAVEQQQQRPLDDDERLLVEWLNRDPAPTYPAASLLLSSIALREIAATPAGAARERETVSWARRIRDCGELLFDFEARPDTDLVSALFLAFLRYDAELS
jgi:hypothetical protein